MSVALITGVASQDGTYLAEALLAAGDVVHGTVRPGSRAPDGVIEHVADLRIPGIAAALVDELRPDVIYNLAAISSIPRSWELPVESARINGMLVAELLDAARRLPDTRFVQASSAWIFGNPARSPQDESTPVRPVSPYGAAKAYAHQLVSVHRAAGLAASSCILFNHESPRRPEQFVTRKITAAAARIANGSDETLELGSLTIRRDWGWAPDYVDALRRSASTPGDYVIATGIAHSIQEFVELAFARAGVDDWRARVRVTDEFARPGDAGELVGDATRAREVLDWAPTKTLDEVVAAMVDADLERAGPTIPRG